VNTPFPGALLAQRTNTSLTAVAPDSNPATLAGMLDARSIPPPHVSPREALHKTFAHVRTCLRAMG